MGKGSSAESPRSFLLATLSCCFCLWGNVVGDIYLHNPRGSNNRLDEATRARANNNRLFDSQNNNRGGYNLGSLFYYQGSTLSIEWTNQHSCGAENNHCELVLQYMCHDTVRDGASTQTIPTNQAQCARYNCDTDGRYGMHENSNHYAQCKFRQRNKGLFIADQNLNNRDNSINTRQNPAGTRRAYECPEERDYYPYWHPSPWVDIAVMTNDVSRCKYYMRESQNVKAKWDCVLPYTAMEKAKRMKLKLKLPNTKEECEKYVLPKSLSSAPLNGTWKEFPPHGVPPPECRETQFTRDNHLGNGMGGHPNMYNWTIPNNVEHEKCVLRIRYNISTTDYSWDVNASMNANPKKRGDGSLLNLAPQLGLASETEAKSRGYIFKGNPEVDIFTGLDMDLRLAVNTAQFGRTFQDRSHTFAIRRRPVELEGETIHNLNVRGKRGNIVQVYPAVEYDFVPNNLEVAEGDYVHVQWTGSNTNPRNNDGQGLAGTDRSNIALLAAQRYSEGDGMTDYHGAKYGHYGVNYPMSIENSTFLGLSTEDAFTMAFLNPGQLGGEMSELDDAGTYFNLNPRKATKKGTYHYMCTRNNNFSNRDQKGKVIVRSSPFASRAIGQMGGTLSLQESAHAHVEEGTFNHLTSMRLEQWSVEEGKEQLKKASRSLSAGDDYASNFYLLTPDNLMETQNNKYVTLSLKLTDDSDGVKIYHAPSDMSAWHSVDAKISNGMAQVQTQSGGVFVARSEDNLPMIIGVSVACAVFVVVVIAGGIFYFRRNPSKWQAVRSNCTNAKRSMHSKV